MSDEIKILLVEDSASYGRVIQRALGGEAAIKEVVQVGTAEMALRNLNNPAEELPDLILLDLSMPGMSGIEAIPLFRQINKELKIIVLTQSDREEDVMKAVSAGAVGYLMKSSTSRQILEAVYSVVGGGGALGPEVSKYVLDALQKQQPQEELEQSLSAREMDTLVLMAEGLSRKEIADQMGIGVTTVVTNINRIYAKMEVKNAPAAVSKAHRSGLLG